MTPSYIRAKQFLDRLNLTRCELDQAKRRYDLWHSESDRITYEQALSDHNQVVQEVTDAINALTRKDYREVLTMRYLDCLTWPQIAEALGMSCRQSAYKRGSVAIAALGNRMRIEAARAQAAQDAANE